MTAPKPRRHKWGEKIVISPYKAERSCQHNCGIVKVTRYEHHSTWVEYWRGLDKVSVVRTPACEMVEQGVDA